MPNIRLGCGQPINALMEVNVSLSLVVMKKIAQLNESTQLKVNLTGAIILTTTV